MVFVIVHMVFVIVRVLKILARPFAYLSRAPSQKNSETCLNKKIKKTACGIHVRQCMRDGKPQKIRPPKAM